MTNVRGMTVVSALQERRWLRTLEDLEDARRKAKSVIVRGDRSFGLLVEKPLPAAIVMHMQGTRILGFLREGLCVYEPKTKGG